MTRFQEQIKKVNDLIRTFAPEQHKSDWQVDVAKGTVAFGSAYHNWGITVPFMQKTGVNFTQIFEFCNNEQQKELAKKAPVHEVLLDMAVEKLPSPLVAQEYRIPNIWQGELDSEVGKTMVNCDAEGPLSLMIT